MLQNSNTQCTKTQLQRCIYIKQANLEEDQKCKGWNEQRKKIVVPSTSEVAVRCHQVQAVLSRRMVKDGEEMQRGAHLWWK